MILVFTQGKSPVLLFNVMISFKQKCLFLVTNLYADRGIAPRSRYYTPIEGFPGPDETVRCTRIQVAQV